MMQSMTCYTGQPLVMVMIMILLSMPSVDGGCTEQSTCDTCVGTFKSTNNCVWCTDSDTCVDTKEADGDDDMSCPGYQDHSCPAYSYYTIVFVIILILLISLCCGLLLSRRLRNPRDNEFDPLDEPLLSEQAREIFERQSLGVNGEQLAGWMCIICGYDNKPRAAHCPMCGTSHEFSDDYKTQKSERQRKARRQRAKEKARRREQRAAAAAAKERTERAAKVVSADSDGDYGDYQPPQNPIAGGMLSQIEEGDEGEIGAGGGEGDETVLVVDSRELWNGASTMSMEDDTDLTATTASGGGAESTSLAMNNSMPIGNGRSNVSTSGGTPSPVSERDGSMDAGVIGASASPDSPSNDLDASRTSILSMSERFEAFTYRRLNTLSARQKIARRRKMWQRVVDEETGEFKWMRRTVAETQIGNSQFGWSPRNSEANTPVKESSMGGSYGKMSGSLLSGLQYLLGGRGSQVNFDDSIMSYASEGNGPGTPPRDSFDQVAGNISSPGFTSVFQPDGTIRWEQVESGMPAATGADVPYRDSRGVKSTNSTPSSTGRHVAPTDYFGLGFGAGSTTDRGSFSSSFRDTNATHLALRVEDMHAAAMLPFKDKQFWFLNHMSDIQKPWADGCIRIDVDRENVLVQSFEQMIRLSRRSLHRFMRVQFTGEPGIDAGGLEREWFALCAERLLDPKFGLFTCSADGEAGGTYHISPLSGHPDACVVAHDHLRWFRFAGRFFAKAVMEQQSLNATLSLPLRKQLLAVPIMFSDLEFVDADVYRNLEWLKTNEGAEHLYLDFTIDYQHNGVTANFPLKPGGGDISVTDANKHEYLLLSLRHRMLDSIRPQLENFLRGFYEVLQ